MAKQSAWRLVKARHAAAAFDGEGARLFGGRWNSLGTRIVYTAESRSLAVLEVLVHLRAAAPLSAYVFQEAVVPEALIETLVRPSRDWRNLPSPESTRRVGDDWIRDHRSAALCVPSVISPAESLLLLNPAHADFGKIELGSPEAFDLDPRLGRLPPG